MNDLKKILKINNKNLKEIRWIGSEIKNYKIPFEQFEEEISNPNNLVIDPTLLIVGDNWWLDRKENQWIYHEYPMPKRLMKIGKTIFITKD